MSEDQTGDIGGTTPQVTVGAPRPETRTDQDALDVAFMVASPSCRRFFCNLLEHTGTYRHTFSTDHAIMAETEGRRAVGLWLIDLLERHAPGSYPGLLAEVTRKAQEARAAADLKKTHAPQEYGFFDGNGILVDTPPVVRNV